MTYDGSNESKDQISQAMKDASDTDLFMILKYISFNVKNGKLDRDYLDYWMSWLQDRELGKSIVSMIDYDVKNDA